MDVGGGDMMFNSFGGSVMRKGVSVSLSMSLSLVSTGSELKSSFCVLKRLRPHAHAHPQILSLPVPGSLEVLPRSSIVMVAACLRFLVKELVSAKMHL